MTVTTPIKPKRILDPETCKQLIGYTPFSSEVTSLYTPEEFDIFKDTSLRPIFSIRSLRQEEHIQLKKNSAGYTKATTPEELTAIADANREIIRKCVTDWTSLFNCATGEEIQFKDDKELFNTLPNWLIGSLTLHIRKISGLSNAEDLGLK